MNSELNNFYRSISHVQNLNQTKIYNLYEKLYKKLLSSTIFKISAVSVNFKITINIEKLNLINLSNNQKLKIKSLIIDSLPKNQISLKIIKEIIRKISQELNLVEDDFKIEILFLKRKASVRDPYSGDISFPGGKYEKFDGNTYNCSIRETFEETGLNLCENYPIISRYLGENNTVETTINLKYIVFSHLFIIFDLFNEIDNHIKLSENEMSNFIWVRIKFFHELNYLAQENKMDYIKEFKNKINLLGNHNVIVEKLKLNKDEKYALYGMTMRILMDILNNNIRFVNYTLNYGINGVFNKMLFKSYLWILTFARNPKYSFNLILIIISLIVFNYIIRTIKPRF